MLIFDQLKKNDPQLRLLAAGILAGLLVLLVGLWWVQVVRARDYRASQETQSQRSVRVPAVRGKILDRDGVVLAESLPNYSINLYLEDLSDSFKKEYRRQRPMRVVTNELSFWQSWLGISEVKTQRVRLSNEQLETLNWQVRYTVANRVVRRISEVLRKPLSLDFEKFRKHYNNQRALPYQIVDHLDVADIARFEEQGGNIVGVDLETESIRVYPYSNVAAHVLGFLQRNNDSQIGEDAFYSHRLTDYRGLVGIEGALDLELRGRAGGKSVLVNSLGYRQTESYWTTPRPGSNVWLTLALPIQQAAHKALLSRAGSQARGAAVVMDVHSGEILALASVPSSNPNFLIEGFPSMSDYARWTNATLGVQKNRATQEQYQAGSIFKTIVALAGLETPEAHFNPLEKYRVQPNPANASRGIIYVGNQPFRDTVAPGDYDLRRAIAKSSNAYFIDLGLRPGVFPRVVELGRRFHLGEKFPPGTLPLRQEAAGHFPDARDIRRNWRDGDTANICIGQGRMDVTPLQVAVMFSALANGGTVLNPKLVDRLSSQETLNPGASVPYPHVRVRDHLGVSKRSLDILREAMLAETEDPEGTGRQVQGCGFRVCGKTGTAERNELRPDGQKKNTTWFASFAPYESPRYAVVVMVEDGQSGGTTCVPIARDIYVALKAYESRQAPTPVARR